MTFGDVPLFIVYDVRTNCRTLTTERYKSLSQNLKGLFLQLDKVSFALAPNPTRRYRVIVPVFHRGSGYFVDEHKAALIDRVNNFGAILDYLLDKEVVSQGSYDKILVISNQRD